ncbi:MAG: glycosyltransferase [Clostridiales bacterium]|nr:glycosyltransferase [Clostridiales bacterium]
MKISVILPVFNAEKWLRRCLESILAQTHRELEIIAVDDGSSDQSLNILGEYAQKDSRIIVIKTAHEGVSAARNAALDIACGDYIGFADGDDVLSDTIFETLLEDITKAAADISICGFWFCYTDGTKRASSNLEEPCILTGDTALEWTLRGDHFAGHLWNKLFRASLFENERFDPELLVCQDVHMCVRLMQKAKRVVFNPTPLYDYCIHDESSYNSPVRAAHLAAHTAYDRIINILKPSFPNLIKYAQAQGIQNDLFLLRRLYRQKTNPDYIRRAHKHLRRMTNVKSIRCIRGCDKYLALAAYGSLWLYRLCFGLLHAAQRIKHRLLHR